MAEVSRYGIIEAATDVDGVAFDAPSDSRLRVIGRMALRGRMSGSGPGSTTSRRNCATTLPTTTRAAAAGGPIRANAATTARRSACCARPPAASRNSRRRCAASASARRPNGRTNRSDLHTRRMVCRSSGTRHDRAPAALFLAPEGLKNRSPPALWPTGKPKCWRSELSRQIAVDL
jgi:hypothetical protein